MSDINHLIKRCHAIELEDLGGEQSSSGLDGWAYVINHVKPATLAHMQSLDDEALAFFIMEDNSGNESWEDFMDTFGKMEEWLATPEGE